MQFDFYFDRDVTFGIRALFSKDFWDLRGVSLSCFAYENDFLLF